MMMLPCGMGFVFAAAFPAVLFDRAPPSNDVGTRKVPSPERKHRLADQIRPEPSTWKQRVAYAAPAGSQHPSGGAR
jgi:hypothetical protein